MTGKQRLTAVVFPETVAATHALAPGEVADPANRTVAEEAARERVAQYAREHRIAVHTAARVEWTCRVSLVGYWTPDGADLEEFRDVVAAHERVDHFGKPAAIEFTYETEVPSP